MPRYTAPVDKRRIIDDKDEDGLDDLARELFEPPATVSVETAMHTFAASCGPERFSTVCGLASRYLHHVGKVIALAALEADVPAHKLSFSQAKAQLRRLLGGLEEAERIVAEGGPDFKKTLWADVPVLPTQSAAEPESASPGTGQVQLAGEAVQEDPLHAIPNPAEGCHHVHYTEGRIRELCGGHLVALYIDGDEDGSEPMILDGRLVPDRLRESGQYVRLVIAVRGEETKP